MKNQGHPPSLGNKMYNLNECPDFFVGLRYVGPSRRQNGHQEFSSRRSVLFPSTYNTRSGWILQKPNVLKYVVCKKGWGESDWGFGKRNIRRGKRGQKSFPPSEWFFLLSPDLDSSQKINDTTRFRTFFFLNFVDYRHCYGNCHLLLI